MNKKMLSLIICSLAFWGTALWSADTQAAHYISSMDIDVNYDPFTDTYNHNYPQEENITQADDITKKPTFSQRLQQSRAVTKPTFTVTQASVKPGNVYLPKGTPINVELLNYTDCKSVRKFQDIEFKTLENLFVNDVIVIPKNTIGKGYVYDVQTPGAFGRKGVLRIAGREIKTINGVKVPLMKGISAVGKTDGGAVVVGALVSLAGGFFMKGKGINFPMGTAFTVEVREDTDLDCKPEELAKVMDPTIPRGQKIYVPAYEFPKQRRTYRP